MLNKIIVTGRLTADPELRKTQSGVSVTSFSIAVQRNYKNPEGERDTDFFNVTAWRNTAEFVTQYFTKGSMVTVDGRLESRKFTDKNGNNRTAIEIVADNAYFGESKGDTQKSETASSDIDFTPEFGVQPNGYDTASFDAFPPFE